MTAADYTLNAHLVSDDPKARFDDNYFDLMAGETRTITVTHAHGAEPPRVELRCWNDRTVSLKEKETHALSD